MTVRVADGEIRLTGQCPAEEAEAIARLLLSDPTAVVDWRDCDHAHTAVVRVLLAAEAMMRGPPRSMFLREWIAPLIGTISE